MSTKDLKLEKSVGRVITLQGKVSSVMWQHFGTYIEGYPHETYIDLEDHPQIVVYSKEPITCEGPIELTGEVIKIDSSENDPRSKIHDGFVEYHLKVESWKCIE